MTDENQDNDLSDAVANPRSDYNKARTARILKKLSELADSAPAAMTSATACTTADTAAEKLSARFGACNFCPTCLDGGVLSAELSQPRFIALHSARYRLAGCQLDFRSPWPLWATQPDTLLSKISPPPARRDILSQEESIKA